MSPTAAAGLAIKVTKTAKGANIVPKTGRIIDPPARAAANEKIIPPRMALKNPQPPGQPKSRQDTANPAQAAIAPDSATQSA